MCYEDHKDFEFRRRKYYAQKKKISKFDEFNYAGDDKKTFKRTKRYHGYAMSRYKDFRYFNDERSLTGGNKMNDHEKARYDHYDVNNIYDMGFANFHSHV